MTRAEYECLKALRFGLPISAPWVVWNLLVNEGWIAPPTPLTGWYRIRGLNVAAFVVTDAGLDALAHFEKWHL